MNITPLQQLIIYILKFAEEQGQSNLSKFQIMKLVYLVEVEYRKFVGEPLISNTKFQRYENGPISTDVYNAIDQLVGKYISVTYSNTEGYENTRACHKSINTNKITFTFSKDQLIFLNCVLSDYVGLTQKKLKEIAYETEPMKEILTIEEKSNKKALGYTIDMNKVPLDEDILEAITNSSQ